jgi:hypothetical protein
MKFWNEWRMETGPGIEPKACLAQLPNGVEARGRRQPTQPVKLTALTR